MCQHISLYILQPKHRIGVAIGEKILDLTEVRHLFDGTHLARNNHVFTAVSSSPSLYYNSIQFNIYSQSS